MGFQSVARLNIRGADGSKRATERPDQPPMGFSPKSGNIFLMPANQLCSLSTIIFRVNTLGEFAMLGEMEKATPFASL